MEDIQMANKNMRAIKEVQIKITLYQREKELEHLERSSTAAWSFKWYNHFGKVLGSFL